MVHRVPVYRLAAVLLLPAMLLVVACAPSAAPAPTAAPTKAAAPAAPTKAAAPAAPTQAAAPAAPTKAPEPTAAPAAKKTDFPVKGRNVNLIIPVSAGGVADTSARMVASLMEKNLGVSMPAVNKPGASSMVGMTEVANAKPDGYTLGVILLPTTTSTFLDPALKATYTRNSFKSIGAFVEDSMALSVGAQTPYKTTKDLVDAAKAKPETIKMGTSGVASINHMSGLDFERVAGVKFAYVHFPGAAEQNTAMLGGHIDGGFAGSSTLVPTFKAQTSRVLGVMSKDANPFLPGVPTLESQGYKTYASVTYGLVVPAGTPAEVVDVLAQALEKSVASQEYKDKLSSGNMFPKYFGPKDFDKHIDDVSDWARPLVQAAKQQ